MNGKPKANALQNWKLIFEVDDDATPDEIKDEAKEIFFNYCNYSYHEIKDEEEEQNG